MSAAVYCGVIYSLPAPARHGEVLFSMPHSGEGVPPECQGFLTSAGRFVNRVEAATIAYKAKQLKGALIAPPGLYSEDLW